MTTSDSPIGAEGGRGTLTSRAGRATNLRPDMARVARFDPSYRQRPRRQGRALGDVRAALAPRYAAAAKSSAGVAVFDVGLRPLAPNAAAAA